MKIMTHSNAATTLEFYASRPTFRTIDGNQPPDVVTASMDSAIREASVTGTGPAGPFEKVRL